MRLTDDAIEQLNPVITVDRNDAVTTGRNYAVTVGIKDSQVFIGPSVKSSLVVTIQAFVLVEGASYLYSR